MQKCDRKGMGVATLYADLWRSNYISSVFSHPLKTLLLFVFIHVIFFFMSQEFDIHTDYRGNPDTKQIIDL